VTGSAATGQGEQGWSGFGGRENPVAGGRRVGGVENTEALLAAFDAQARATPPAPPAGVWHEADGPVLRVVGQERGFISAPRDTGARGSDLGRLIARQRDYFAGRREAVEWKTYDYDEPADLPDRLRAAGFVPEDPETVVVALTTAIAAEPVLPDGVVLRQVTADEDMRRVAAMESEVWDRDREWTGEHLIREVAAAPDDYIVLTAEAAGQVVAAGWLEMRPGSQFAGLWGGATLAEWRGRGIYRALVSRRAQLAAARGVPYLQVDASSDSAPILRRLGFQAIATTTPYVWSPKS
jgi:GNAT superfamily N-acetyltransferase